METQHPVPQDGGAIGDRRRGRPHPFILLTALFLAIGGLAAATIALQHWPTAGIAQWPNQPVTLGSAPRSDQRNDRRRLPDRFTQLVGHNITIVFENPKPADTINRISNIPFGVDANNTLSGTLVAYDPNGWLVIDANWTDSRDFYRRVFIPRERVVSLSTY